MDGKSKGREKGSDLREGMEGCVGARWHVNGWTLGRNGLDQVAAGTTPMPC